MDAPTDTEALESLLRWYAAMGVDAAVDETPHDRFVAAQQAPPPEPTRQAPSRQAPSLQAPSHQAPSHQAPERRQAPDRPAPPAHRPMPDAAAPASAEAQIAEAQARAAGADSLEALRESFSTQPGLGLATSARMIFAGGTPGARLMLIGAAPESDDERQGEAFAGKHGQLLDAMLKAIGLDRTGVYLAHVVPWRPPGNRPPTPLELSLCLPYTRRHIALAAPDVILCLGERAAQPLLGSRDPISRLRGRWLTYEGDAATTKLLATFSPTYLLSQPLQKRRAWVDLQMLRAALANQPA